MVRVLSLICNYFTLAFAVLALIGLSITFSENGDFSLPGLMVVFVMTITSIVSLVFIHQNKPIDLEKESMKKELEKLKTLQIENKS
jgi:hypothetical protein